MKSAEKEGYKFVHPFDGVNTLQGSATLGLEIINQMKNINTKIDNVLISVGGGGLISGVGSALKQFFPEIKIFGVEPDNAKGMTESLKIDAPLSKVQINSIADSLCAPLHMPYSFNVAKNVIDQMINVSDKEMINNMLYTYVNLKLLLDNSEVTICAIIIKLCDKFNDLKFLFKSFDTRFASFRDNSAHSSMLTPSRGTNGHTSTAPSLGCSPE